jgi:hypothetical protein
MRFLRRRLVSALVALVLAGVGFSVTFPMSGVDGETQFVSPLSAPGRAQAEFERVTAVLNEQSGNNRASNTKRKPTPIRPATERPGSFEPKVIEIEYDDAGKTIGGAAPGSGQSNPGVADPEANSQVIDVGDDGNGDVTSKRTRVRAAGTNPHIDSERHFSLDLPMTWQEMSGQELRTINRGASMLGLGVQVKYQAGFRRKNTRPGTCPYILVSQKSGRLHSYEEVEQALEKEMPKCVEKAEGALSKLGANLSIDGVTFDRERNRISFRSQMDVTGVGTIQAFSVGHIGSEGVVFVHCYALANEFSAWVNTFDRINDSFAFDEGFEFVEQGSASGIDGLMKSLSDISWGMGTLLGACGGLFAGITSLLMFRPKRRRPVAYASAVLPPVDGGANPANRVEDPSHVTHGWHEMAAGQSVDAASTGSLVSVSRVLSWLIPLTVMGFGGYYWSQHGEELKEGIPHLRQVVGNWWIETATGHNLDDIQTAPPMQYNFNPTGNTLQANPSPPRVAENQSLSDPIQTSGRSGRRGDDSRSILRDTDR